jgi:DNA-directed RNA polymerase specialized sigma24 family protein
MRDQAPLALELKTPAAQLVAREEVSHLHALHERVLGGDPLAVDRLGTILVRRVRPIVCSRRHKIDVATAEQATLDAVSDYLFQPARFDARRSSLLTWIAFAAIRNVDDHKRAETKRRVAEAAAAREWDRVRQPQTQGPDHDLASLLREAVYCDTDAKLIIAWLGGRPTSQLAEILGVSSLPEGAMRKFIGRAKERLRLRLKRAASRSKGDSVRW